MRSAKNVLFRIVGFAVVVGTLACFSAQSAFARNTNYWVGNVSSTWSTAGNWLDGTVPTIAAAPNGDDIIFDANATGSLNVTYDMTVGAVNNSYHLITMASTCPGNVTINAGTIASGKFLAMGGSVGIDMSAATHNLTINGDYAARGYDERWDVKTGTTLTFNGVLSGYTNTLLSHHKLNNTNWL